MEVVFQKKELKKLIGKIPKSKITITMIFIIKIKMINIKMKKMTIMNKKRKMIHNKIIKGFINVIFILTIIQIIKHL